MEEQVLGKPQGRKSAGQIKFFREGGGVGEGDVNCQSQDSSLMRCSVFFFNYLAR